MRYPIFKDKFNELREFDELSGDYPEFFEATKELITTSSSVISEKSVVPAFLIHPKFPLYIPTVLEQLVQKMLPFSIDLKAGAPISEQIVFAVKRSVVAGQLREGDKFPSVRALSQELKVNANTAHKVVAQLVREGVLIATPAVGTIVAPPPEGTDREKAKLLGAEIEWLVVQGRTLGLSLEEIQESLAAQWRRHNP